MKKNSTKRPDISERRPNVVNLVEDIMNICLRKLLLSIMLENVIVRQIEWQSIHN